MSDHGPMPLILRDLNLPLIARGPALALERAEVENRGCRRFRLHLAEGEANERLRRRIERQTKESGRSRQILTQERVEEDGRQQESF